MLPVSMTLSENKLLRVRWAIGPRHRPPVSWNVRFLSDGRIEGAADERFSNWKMGEKSLQISDLAGALSFRSSLLHVREDGGIQVILRSVDGEEEYTVAEHTSDGRLGFGSHGALSDVEFLFPRDLRVSSDGISKVLLIGSCLMELYRKIFEAELPEVSFDYIQFNNAGRFPQQPPKSPDSYDFQYIQLPLRSVLTDRVVFATILNEPAVLDAIIADGCASIDAMLDSALSFNRSHGLLTFVCTFLVPQMNVVTHLAARHTNQDLSSIVRRLNDYLAVAVRSCTNVFICDTDAIANSVGKRYCLDDVTGFFAHGTPLHQDEYDGRPGVRIEKVPPLDSSYGSRGREFLLLAWEQAVSTFRTVRQIDQVKAVVFDLDNTLWRGQIAEDYRIDSPQRPPGGGWQPGLWEAVHHLRARGILIAICSKNDLQVVTDNWENVVDPPFLKLEHFTTAKINWEYKSENIRQICQDLNLKPKNVVFVDDNPVEREGVKASIPGIRVIGSNPYVTRRILLWSAETQLAHLTTESLNRDMLIRRQMVREESRLTMSREQFLQSLETNVRLIEIDRIDRPELVRALELTNKTNQFNTNGKRWSLSDVVTFLSAGGRITAFTVKDKFADYGLVGVVYHDRTRIQQLLMSCRVIGMEVEHYVLAMIIAEKASIAPGAKVAAEIVETADNSPCRDVFIASGFREVSSAGGVRRFECECTEVVQPSYTSPGSSDLGRVVKLLGAR